MKCIAEDIKANSMTVGKYHIVNPNEGHPLPNSHKVTVKVTSSYGNSYHYADHVNSGQFAFQASESGDYMACFFAVDNKAFVTMTIDFKWKSSVAAKDWSSVAKKGSVEVVYSDVYMLDNDIEWKMLPLLSKPDSRIEFPWMIVNISIVIVEGTTEEHPKIGSKEGKFS